VHCQASTIHTDSLILSLVTGTGSTAANVSCMMHLNSMLGLSTLQMSNCGRKDAHYEIVKAVSLLNHLVPSSKKQFPINWLSNIIPGPFPSTATPSSSSLTILVQICTVNHDFTTFSPTSIVAGDSLQGSTNVALHSSPEVISSICKGPRSLFAN